MATKLTQTGAQVQDLLDDVEIYNVKSYGAIGDGVADDSTAINTASSAVASAGGGYLLFPYGDYNYTFTRPDPSVTWQIDSAGSKAPNLSVSSRFGKRTIYGQLEGPHPSNNLALLHLMAEVEGSGANLASAADFGLTVSVRKKNYLSAPGQGEINGMLIFVENAGGDESNKFATGGIVGDVRSIAGTGFTAFAEATTRIVNASNVDQRTINVQLGVLNDSDDDYYGVIARSDLGAADSAFYGLETINGTFGNLIQGYKASTNVRTYQVDMDGKTTIKSDDTGNNEINFGLSSGVLQFKNHAGTVLFSVGQTGSFARSTIVPDADGATLTAADTGKVYTNEGATAGVTFTLPAAAAGLEYTFIVADADGITVTAASGDTIRVAGSVTPAAGNISATTIGNVITIKAINATEWITTSVVGTWTVSS